MFDFGANAHVQTIDIKSVLPSMDRGNIDIAVPPSTEAKKR